MLEVATDDRAHANRLRQPFYAGPQAADTAHDQIDLRSGCGGGVERVDDLRIDEAVHLHDDAAVLRGRFLADQLEEPRTQRPGRDEDLAVAVPVRSSR